MSDQSGTSKASGAREPVSDGKGGLPEVAVIMPCYNPGPEIGETLASLSEQTVAFKLFVTDDGSAKKPDYHTLLQGFNYELIELEQNVGVCIVRNPSMQRALEQGFEYLAQIDCGDWAHPKRLEEQLDFLKSHPDVKLVGTAVRILDDDMNHLYDFTPHTDPAKIKRSLYYGLAFKHPAMMQRASLIREIGLYTNEYDAAEDFELARRAARVAELANLPNILMTKVESINSVSSKKRTVQLMSRLRIQWKYRDVLSIHCWLGMLKTLVVLVVPTKWVKSVQPLLYGKQDGKRELSKRESDDLVSL
jgi:glycosyltransferase involved in cell wall biosynthesis